ncbi:MAG: hypothetical protein AB1Z98_35330 [Nannocystaceae bacterium]
MSLRRFFVLVSMLGAVGLSCTVEGEDVATTFGDPTVNPSGNPPGTSDGGDTESNATMATDSGTVETEGPATSGPTSTTDPTDSESTGEPIDEQPANGMYSECTTVADCIGQTTCVLVAGSPTGFCSSTCADAGLDCDPSPGATSTASPACVDNAGMLVCGLSCSGGLTCPGGMQCLALGASMVCV